MAKVSSEKHAVDCYHDLDRCPRERELAEKLAKTIEAKLADNPDLNGTVVLSQGMKPPPKDLKGFPGAVRTKPKTPFAGGLRKRWKLADGGFADWDYMHGEVEVYNDQGKHQGAFDPDTGEQIDPPDPTKTAPK
jgi:Cytotoxic